MFLDRINPSNLFRPRSRSVDIAHRQLIEDPVTVTCVRQLSEHGLFGLDGASAEAIRRSCWPIGADAPRALALEFAAPTRISKQGGIVTVPELGEILGACALAQASPASLEVNRNRLGEIRNHYREVLNGNAEFADPKFTITVMRPFMTWLKALSPLDENTHGRSGQCANDLMSIVMSLEGGCLTFRQLGSTDDLSGDINGRAIAAHFLEQVAPLLVDFIDVIERNGVGSRVLEQGIKWLGASQVQEISWPRRAS